MEEAGRASCATCLDGVAGLTRLELATSDVTGRVRGFTSLSLFKVFHTLGDFSWSPPLLKVPNFYPKIVLKLSLEFQESPHR